MALRKRKRLGDCERGGSQGKPRGARSGEGGGSRLSKASALYGCVWGCFYEICNALSLICDFCDRSLYFSESATVVGHVPCGQLAVMNTDSSLTRLAR